MLEADWGGFGREAGWYQLQKACSPFQGGSRLLETPRDGVQLTKQRLLLARLRVNFSQEVWPLLTAVSSVARRG